MPQEQTARPVLIIEDDAEIRRFAGRVLELEGYRVLEAGSGEEGLSLARQTAGLGAVLLDLRLPGCDGWTVIAKLKADSRLKQVPVVVFSASAAQPDRQRAAAAGAITYLVKPLDAARLRAAVSAGLGQGGNT